MADARVDTIVAGGQVVTSSEIYSAAIAIDGEKIVASVQRISCPPPIATLTLPGKFVLPGLIDCHVHLDRCDSYELGSIAAAHSGLTTLIPFGTYDVEAEETLPSAINRHREEIESTAVVDFAFHYILNNRPYILKSLPQALEMGVTSYKMFMTYKKNQIRMCSDDFICQVMETVSKGGGIVQLHCESGNIIDYLENQLISNGCVHPTDFPSACPDWAEEEAINRAVKMGAVTDCPVYVVHLSSQVGLERIKLAQAQGQRVWTETCPQYLLLSDEEMAKVGPLAKIGPPLRPKTARTSLLCGKAWNWATFPPWAAITRHISRNLRSPVGITSLLLPTVAPYPSGPQVSRLWRPWHTAKAWQKEDFPSLGSRGACRKTRPASSASIRKRDLCRWAPTPTLPSSTRTMT